MVVAEDVKPVVKLIAKPVTEGGDEGAAEEDDEDRTSTHVNDVSGPPA